MSSHRVRLFAPLLATLLTAACGSDRREPPPLRLIGDDVGAGNDAPRVAGPPDAGTRAGQGGDLERRSTSPLTLACRRPP